MFRNAGVLGRAWLVLACVAGGMTLSSASAQTSVSSSGTATHSHSIVVPPGIGGMQPNVSLLYSGGGVNGPVGHGWSVQGISMITRCPATRFIDGQPRGVMYDSSDKLCMDGQRLIQTDAGGNPLPMPQANDASGVSGNGWREYRTERDSYARIRAYGTWLNDVANGPQYFKVWTKAGQIYEYGASPLSGDGNTRALVQVQGRNTIMVWAVGRISDVVGNFIDFKYEQRDSYWGSGQSAGVPTIGREWNIVEIQYTGNRSTPAANKVVFRYLDRPDDRSEAYQRGAKNLSIRRLIAIDTYVNSPNTSDLGPGAFAVLARRVGLTYDLSPTTNRSRVVSIKECADVAETRCQPPTWFNYAPGNGETLQEGTLSSGAFSGLPLMKWDGSMGTIPLDLNGDGRTDLLRWAHDASQNRVYLSELGEGGDFRESSAFNLAGEPLFSEDACYASMIADFNGDGIPDILRHVATKSKDNAACSTARPPMLYLGNGDGGFTARNVTGVTMDRSGIALNCNGAPPKSCVWYAANNFYVLDVDGDGRADIVTAYMPAKPYQAPVPTCPTGTACTRVFKGDGNGGFTEIASNLASEIVYTMPLVRSSIGEPGHVSDVDGDGLADLTGMGSSLFGTTTTSWRSRGDGNFDPITAPAPCTTPIDFNGDGRADCLEPGATTTTANVLRVSDGTGTMPTVASFNLTGAGELKGTGVGFVVIDVNGDGRDDILRWKDDPTQNRLYLSNGDGSFRLSTSFNLNTAGRQLRSSDGKTDFLVGNFDGSGQLQILRIKDSPVPGSSTGNTIYKAFGTHADLLVSVISPTGQRTELSYQSLAEKIQGGLTPTDNLYRSDRGTANAAVWPLMDLTPATPVVSRVANDAIPGRLFQITTNYFYAGMKVAVDGRGPLGFRRTGQDQLGANGEKLTVWTDYRMDEPYAGVASRTETFGPGGQLLSRTINAYCDRTSGTNPDEATETAPCTGSSTVRRPYVRRSVESGWDLNGTPLPSVTTTSTYNDYGDPTRIDVVTAGAIPGVGVQSSTKVTENTYCAPDSSGCPNRISGDDWILGRLTRSKVTNTVPKLVDTLTTSAGTSPTASATTGNQQTQAPMNPAVLAAILQLLLDE